MHSAAATPVSIFDLDRTITRTGTWVPWLLFWTTREAPWRFVQFPFLALAGLTTLIGVLPRARLKQFGMWLIMQSNVPRLRVDRIAADYADWVIARNVYGGALTQIAADRAEGRRIVIATASAAFYVRAIAARLGVNDVVATEFIWERGTLQPRLAGANCYGAAKLAQVEAWLAGEGLEGAPIRVYSDHISDLPLFKRADECIATTPSPALRALAVARGWRVIDWGKASTSLFERA